MHINAFGDMNLGLEISCLISTITSGFGETAKKGWGMSVCMEFIHCNSASKSKVVRAAGHLGHLRSL